MSVVDFESFSKVSEPTKAQVCTLQARICLDRARRAAARGDDNLKQLYLSQADKWRKKGNLRTSTYVETYR